MHEAPSRARLSRVEVREAGRERGRARSTGRATRLIAVLAEHDIGSHRAEVGRLRGPEVVRLADVEVRRVSENGQFRASGVNGPIEQQPRDRLEAGGLRERALVRHVVLEGWKKFADGEFVDSSRRAGFDWTAVAERKTISWLISSNCILKAD